MSGVTSKAHKIESSISLLNRELFTWKQQFQSQHGVSATDTDIGMNARMSGIAQSIERLKRQLAPMRRAETLHAQGMESTYAKPIPGLVALPRKRSRAAQPMPSSSTSSPAPASGLAAAVRRIPRGRRALSNTTTVSSMPVKPATPVASSSAPAAAAVSTFTTVGPAQQQQVATSTPGQPGPALPSSPQRVVPVEPTALHAVPPQHLTRADAPAPAPALAETPVAPDPPNAAPFAAQNEKALVRAAAAHKGVKLNLAGRRWNRARPRGIQATRKRVAAARRKASADADAVYGLRQDKVRGLAAARHIDGIDACMDAAASQAQPEESAAATQGTASEQALLVGGEDSDELRTLAASTAAVCAAGTEEQRRSAHALLTAHVWAPADPAAPVRPRGVRRARSSAAAGLSTSPAQGSAIAKLKPSTRKRAPLAVPLCTGHFEPCKLRTVKKSGANKGRKFYSCPYGRRGCNFFLWADDHVAKAVAAFLAGDAASTSKPAPASNDSTAAAATLRWCAYTVPTLRAEVQRRALLTRAAEWVKAVLHRDKLPTLSSLNRLQALALLTADDARIAMKPGRAAAAASRPRERAAASASSTRLAGPDQMISLDSSDSDDLSVASSASSPGDASEPVGLPDGDDELMLLPPAALTVDELASVPRAPVAALRHVFGYDEFRQGQQQVVEAILAGQSCLYIAATGLGKSLTYMLPAAMLPGVTVVVSPLVALMQDQVLQLPPCLRGVALTGSQSAKSLGEALRLLVDGQAKVLYISPERLTSSAFIRFMRDGVRGPQGQIMAMPAVSLLVVDEAHCMSDWSINFRPAYMRLMRNVRSVLRPERVLGLTATVSPATQAHVCAGLGLTPDAMIRADVQRDNLLYACCTCSSEDSKSAALRALMRSITEPGAQLELPGSRSFALELDNSGGILIYATTQAETEAVASMISAAGVPAAAYHAGQPASTRTRTAARFLRGSLRCVVATIAFGQGVNKPDIRAVIHYSLPKSLTDYCQQVGRAGRDGEPALCVALLCPSDVMTCQALTVKGLASRATLVAGARALWSPVQPWQQQQQQLQQPLDSDAGQAAGPAGPAIPSDVEGIWLSLEYDWAQHVLGLKQEAVDTLVAMLESLSWAAVHPAGYAVAHMTLLSGTLEEAAANSPIICALLQLYAVIQTHNEAVAHQLAACGAATVWAPDEQSTAVLHAPAWGSVEPSVALADVVHDGHWVSTNAAGRTVLRIPIVPLANALGQSPRWVQRWCYSVQDAKGAAVEWSRWAAFVACTELPVPPVGSPAEQALLTSLCKRITQNGQHAVQSLFRVWHALSDIATPWTSIANDALLSELPWELHTRAIAQLLVREFGSTEYAAPPTGAVPDGAAAGPATPVPSFCAAITDPPADELRRLIYSAANSAWEVCSAPWTDIAAAAACHHTEAAALRWAAPANVRCLPQPGHRGYIPGPAARALRACIVSPWAVARILLGVRGPQAGAADWRGSAGWSSCPSAHALQLAGAVEQVLRAPPQDAASASEED